MLLEEEFKTEQARMEAVLVKSNTDSRDITHLELRTDEIIHKTEKRGVEQKEEQDEAPPPLLLSCDDHDDDPRA